MKLSSHSSKQAHKQFLLGLIEAVNEVITVWSDHLRNYTRTLRHLKEIATIVLADEMNLLVRSCVPRDELIDLTASTILRSKPERTIEIRRKQLLHPFLSFFQLQFHEMQYEATGINKELADLLLT